MCGSNNSNRKKIDANGKLSMYWKPVEEKIELKEMIEDLQDDSNAHSVIVFGEIYGPGIQDMQYGGKVEFRAFDIAINGDYMDSDDFFHVCKKYGIETVPVLYRGYFSEAILMEHTDGETTVCDKAVSKFKGREGCVVRPMEEVLDYDLPSTRVILKSISADYLDRKGATDNA